MTAIADRTSVAETVVVRRWPAGSAAAPAVVGAPAERTNGRPVTPEGRRPAVRTVPPRPAPAPARPAAPTRPLAPAAPGHAAPARHRAPAGWGYPPPTAYPQAPLPSWAALAPAGLAAPSGPLTGPIFVTGPTRLDALLRRWLP